jgi:DNA polymerase-1
MDRIVQQVHELPDFSGEQVLVCDTETTGLFGHLGDRICGISIGPWDRDENYYIPVRHALPATLTRSEGKLVECHSGYEERQNMLLFDVFAWMRRLTENPARTWVFHNAKFDLGMLRRDQVECYGPIQDTILMAHGVVSNLHNYALTTLSKLLLKGFEHPHHEELVGWFQDSMGINLNARKYSEGDEPPNFSFAPIELLGNYAMEDLRATRLVYQALRTKPGNTKIPNQGNKSDTQRDLINRENALEKVVFEMEDRGVKIDIQRCCELRDKTLDEIGQFSDRLYSLAGYSFRISSWKELWKAFEKAGGQVLYWTKKEADKYKQKADKFTENKEESSGRPCWNSAAIAKYLERFLRENNKPGFQFVYNYYQCDHRMRIMSNYIDTILQRVDHNGALHSSIKQHGTLHGRFASAGPNTQNITKSEGNADMKKIEKILGVKDEEAVNRKLRDLFIPRPGFTWVSIDWKQIEYLVVTYFSCDEDMIRRFWENPDLDYHQITADLAGIDRDWAKTVNFGTLYGMGVGSLAAMLGISREKAQLLLDKIFGARPALKRIINQVSESVRKNGYIINPLGRKVPCSPEYAYVGLNYWVAGTVGDMMKERMLAIYEQIVKNSWPVYMLLTVHDELCFEIETSRVSELAPKLGETMCDVKYIKMPIRCDIEVGTSWGTVKPLKEWKAA